MGKSSPNPMKDNLELLKANPDLLLMNPANKASEIITETAFEALEIISESADKAMDVITQASNKILKELPDKDETRKSLEKSEQETMQMIADNAQKTMQMIMINANKMQRTVVEEGSNPVHSLDDMYAKGMKGSPYQPKPTLNSNRPPPPAPQYPPLK